MTDRQHLESEDQRARQDSAPRPAYCVAKLKQGRGLGAAKKTLVEEAKADKAAYLGDATAKAVKKLRLDPDGHSAARINIKYSPHHPRDLFSAYLSGAISRRIAFYQIDALTWCAEIFDPSTTIRYHGVDSWAIVKARPETDGSETYSCMRCPDYAHYQDCVHVRVLASDARPDFEAISEKDNPECLAFDFVRKFEMSPAIISYVLLGDDGPELVTYSGFDLNVGDWTCSKPGHRKNCSHIKLAKDSFVHDRLMTYNHELPADQPLPSILEVEADLRKKADAKSLYTQVSERCVSHLPVGPPRWCRLDGDPDSAPTVPTHYANPYDHDTPLPAATVGYGKSAAHARAAKRAAATAAAASDETEGLRQRLPPRTLPMPLPLGSSARCRCGAGQLAGAAIELAACWVYTSTTCFEWRVEVARCARCRPQTRRYAGPDLREYGLFNMNNSCIYTHKLLNGYTSSLTAHTVPFVGFCTATQRKYDDNDAPRHFVDDDDFRSAWIAFVQIQWVTDSFRCERCGVNPRVVIWDGVTAGFNAEHRTSDLQPPTMVGPGAPIRDNVHRPDAPLSAVYGPSRKLAQDIVRWRRKLNAQGESEVGGIGDNDIADVAADADRDQGIAKRQMERRRNTQNLVDSAMRGNVQKAAAFLRSKVNESLGDLFEEVVPFEPDGKKEALLQRYLRLLDQVLAHESVLQFAPFSSWDALTLFMDVKDVDTARVLDGFIPALGAVAVYEAQSKAGVTDRLVEICRFIRRRSFEAFASLPDHQPEVPDISLCDGLQEKIKTGTVYGRSRIRLRPVYKHLPGDSKVDRATISTEDNAGGIGCNKFYEEYAVKGQTGGMMAAWCPHLVCLGFHVIPKGEGRNDVFSAIFAHWEVAPEIIVYDFACALAPYCMAREPEYFKNTRFLIDNFHAGGHTRCSEACFLKSYRRTDMLARVNSSAAECGNSGLSKIRKSLKYMTQRHAVLYALVYLATWNRARRLKDDKLSSSTPEPDRSLPLDAVDYTIPERPAGSAISIDM